MGRNIDDFKTDLELVLNKLFIHGNYRTRSFQNNMLVVGFDDALLVLCISIGKTLTGVN